MNKRLLHIGLAAAALLGVVDYGVAQTISVPQVSTLNPNNDVINDPINGTLSGNTLSGRESTGRPGPHRLANPRRIVPAAR